MNEMRWYVFTNFTPYTEGFVLGFYIWRGGGGLWFSELEYPRIITGFSLGGVGGLKFAFWVEMMERMLEQSSDGHS